MAKEKAKSKSKNNTGKKPSTQKNNTQKKPKLNKSEQKRLEEEQMKIKGDITAIILMGVALFLFICVISSRSTGLIGGYLSPFVKHLFGTGSIILPIILLIFSVQTLFFDDNTQSYKLKLTLFLSFFVVLVSLCHIFSSKAGSGIGEIPFGEFIYNSFTKGGVKNGGLLGALIGGGLSALIGKTGATILFVVVAIVLIILATGKSVADMANSIGDWVDNTKDEYNEYRKNHIVIDEEDYNPEDDEELYYNPPKRKKALPRESTPREVEKHEQMRLPVNKMSRRRNSVFIDIEDEEDYKDEPVIVEETLFNDYSSSRRSSFSDLKDSYIENAPIINIDDGEIANNSMEESPAKEPKINEMVVPEVEEFERVEKEKTPSEKPLSENNSDKDTLNKAEEIKKESSKNDDLPPWEEKKDTSNHSNVTIIEAEETKAVKKLNTTSETPYKFPPTSILTKNSNKKNVATRSELLSKSQQLCEAFATFGINMKMDKISQGPAVTRYEMIPPKGTPVSKIKKLDKDIELAMAAKSVRIEAPIPGTNKIGVELGNDTVAPVYFSEVLLTDKFRDYNSKLAFGIGKDITGTVIVTDISDMTHLLIAGATGAGKSVCINTLITSILYKATPDEVKLIMIDPKKVELSVYNGIPHLLIPVVSDVQKAAGALNWAIREMERRYDLLEKYGVRNIKGYNKLKDVEKLPYIVIIIDELADLMMTTGKEVENAIVRITQLARAAGMHLVIATQRPDANIVTGLIKANVPSRIAFKVAGSVNSKIILDETGAEKLLGRGDMLLKTRAFDDKPLRIQGAFVTDEEVEAIVDSIKTDESHYDSSIIDEIERSVAEAHGEESSSGDMGGDNELIDEVINLVCTQQKASTSFIQRKFKIGYNRAARIIDELEERGIVGPDLGGTKGREVKMDKYQYREWKERQSNY